MCWANVGDWLVQLVDGWRWRHIVGPTLVQRIFTNSYYDAVGPTLAQRNSTNCYLDIVGPMLAQHYTCQLMSAKIVFFNSKYYLTCAYAIIRSILTKKNSNCVYGMVNP
jgi:hypothetical protein